MRSSPSPHEPSTAYVFAQALISLLCAGFGMLLGIWLDGQGVLNGGINLVYLSFLGLLVGYLLSIPTARLWERNWYKLFERIRAVEASTIFAAGLGTIIALIITVLLNSILERVPGFTWYWSLLITCGLVASSVWFFVSNQVLLKGFMGMGNRTRYEAIANTEGNIQKVIDTSAIIDGRIGEIVESNFLTGEILIPRFVLSELQHIADSSDPAKRKRGRLGLEVLDKLIEDKKIKTSIIDADFPEIKQVDDKLIKLCQEQAADMITTDFNLNRVAALQGIRVLNVNQLAHAIRAVVVPGEQLSVELVKGGRDPGQALAYLDDGTMIVVDNADRMIGETVKVNVSSHLQTNAGRMIFAKLAN